ncbi:galactose-specific lectin nattectin-like [Antennarius striatus]|uniref:galactose-specific lectin nattectin-like n=1 Tax=Antennarius striatus TaxID=241820 RepID=UPI0035AEF2AF
MKTQLLVCLLGVFLSVSAAADVQEERAEVSIPGVAPEETPRSASQCPEGWQSHQDHCYLVVNLVYDRINAEFQCESFSSSLASVHNLWEYTFLQQMTRKAGLKSAWIGGYRFQGYWRWDDGTPFNYNNWYSNDGSSYKECIYLNSEGVYGWSNEECRKSHPFICSMKLSC